MKIPKSGMKKMSDEELDREIIELNERISMMSMLLQAMENEDQKVGWNIKNKIKRVC